MNGATQKGAILAYEIDAMKNSRILIIDESRFSRVCSAILEAEGYDAETVSVDGASVENDDFGLVIASYPFGSDFFVSIGMMSLPVIVLTDHISRDLLSVLEGLERSYCLMKPLNYERFLALVRKLMSGEFVCPGGYSIV